ncbi:GMC family oxidoreductase [Edaphobacter bradus]|uniref:GMC family oxidoreductase n=1 Tax=Edaphobacter bradus TaxID=2259016 RepID=UPI0021E07165|nr:GMC family oxidoreductase N-terminal domain-containing protein [Edaphobacter bradus]
MTSKSETQTGDNFAERVHANQRKLRSNLKTQYDFVICGSGSSGSVVASRLAENPAVSVLLLEAGGDDDVPSVSDARQWVTNIGSERYWQFKAEPNPHLNGRALPLGMGKVLGGGSSINGMIWARGHKSDWDFFASETGDPAWSYESVLDIYRRIEDWQGAPDPRYRGTRGPVFVQPLHRDPTPAVRALFEGISSLGIPIFENQNGRIMEADGGASAADMRIRDGKRQSVFRAYVFPQMDQPNLTVLPHALVTRLTFEGNRTTGVEISYEGSTRRIRAGREVILSLGAIHTPKVLMQSGIGDQAELLRFGIPVVQHLPGVGHGFQDHPAFCCLWECSESLPPSLVPGAVIYGKSEAGLASPDFQILQAVLSAGDAAKFGLPARGWCLIGNVVRPKSRGRVRLTGSDPTDPVQIEANYLCDPDDRKAALACVELCREIGNSHALRPFVTRELIPDNLERPELENYIRDTAFSLWHQTSTAQMGRQAMSVVDGYLKVYGVDNLRIADGSIMPRVTTGNTMAPCVIVGERAAEVIRDEHQIGTASGSRSDRF